MTTLKQTQNFLKLREKSKKKYDISIFSLLPKELIAKCMLPAMWQYKKDYRRWLDDVKLNSYIFKDLGRYSYRSYIADQSRRLIPENEKKTMMKCLLQTELLKKRRRHPPIRNKKTK